MHWRSGVRDRGEPQYLAHVVASGHVIPPQLAPVVGDIIGRTRKVNDKAVAKLQTGAVASAVAACRLACAREIERMQRASTKPGSQPAGTQRDAEPNAVRRESEAHLREYAQELANELGISVAVLLRRERELRRFVEGLTRS